MILIAFFVYSLFIYSQVHDSDLDDLKGVAAINWKEI